MAIRLKQLQELRLNLNTLLLLLHGNALLLLFKLFDLLGEESRIASVHNVKEELSVDELVSFWLDIWQVLDDFWS